MDLFTAIQVPPGVPLLLRVMVLPKQVQKPQGPVLLGVALMLPAFRMVVVAVFVAVQPAALVTVTVYVAAAFTVIEAIVAPVLHT